MEHFKSAVKIFKQLLMDGEISRKENSFLYGEYLEYEVQEALACFEEEFECKLLNFDDFIYLVPNINSQLISMQPSEFKKYFGSNATNKDVYLGYYIIMFIFFEFYNGKNRDPKKTDFIQISHLISRLDERFDRLGKLAPDKIEMLEDDYRVNLSSSIELWTNMLVAHDSKRKTKSNAVKNVCDILEDNKLAYVVENQIRTTKKLDILMRQYYLNADRTKLLLEAFEEGVL